MVKSERFLFGIEYRWGTYMNVFAENQDDAIQQVKHIVLGEWDYCGHITCLPPLVTGDASWTFKQWKEEREKILEQFGKVG